MASDLKLKINQTASLERALKFAAKFWRRRVRFEVLNIYDDICLEKLFSLHL